LQDIGDTTIEAASAYDECLISGSNNLNIPNHKSRAELLCLATSIMNTANSRHDPLPFAMRYLAEWRQHPSTTP
jgi:hypothetical protein